MTASVGNFTTKLTIIVTLMTRTGNSITLCTIPITEAEHTIGQFGWIDGIGEGSFVKALKLLLVETL